MRAINRNNYEAYLLDLIEGRLTHEDKVALSEFLMENPDIEIDLGDIEGLEISPVEETFSWDGLKKPGLAELQQNIDAREWLYFNALEGEISKAERQQLNDLLKEKRYSEEFESWQKTVLQPGEDTLEKESLYQLGLDEPINESNFESYAIASMEGLLDEAQKSELHSYASSENGRLEDLLLYSKLKLEAPRGVFYPNKNELRKKEARGVLFFVYRAAAVVLLIGFGAFLYTTFEGSNSTPIAGNGKTKPLSSESDSSGKVDQEPVKEFEEAIPAEPKNSQVPLEQWEIYEPDPVELAATNPVRTPKANLPEDTIRKPKIKSERIAPIEVEFPETDLLFAENKELQEDPTDMSSRVESTQSIPTRAANSEFQTLPELAEEQLAKQLNLPDEERDQLALSLAKKLTEKAGETLNTEIKKKTSEDDQNLTYSLRIGGFRVSHTTQK